MASIWSIRDCRQDEVDAVLEVWRQADAVPTVTDTPADVLRVLLQDNAFLLVAETQNRIVGTVIGGFDGWRGNIYRLAVLPEYRRRGIAAALVAEADSRLAQWNVRRITALVEKDHPWATGFWDATSYEPDPGKLRYVQTL